MTVQSCTADAVIIGGGFYGSAIAIYLAKTRGLRRVILLERESKLLVRASYNNQARVALLHKSISRRVILNPGRGYATAAV